MSFSFIKIVLLLLTNISLWQAQTHGEILKRLGNSVSQPLTTLQIIDSNNIAFISYATYRDPHNKYKKIMHDAVNITNWLFIFHENNETINELEHRGLHNGVQCNVLKDNKILMHLTITGLIRMEIIFRVTYNVYDTELGTVAIINIDKSFNSDKISDFSVVVWTFPHPYVKDLVVIVMQGNIRSSYPIFLIKNNIKLHIFNVLQNFGEKLVL